jgi:predicted nucleotidyltransferase component of viral defense system
MAGLTEFQTEVLRRFFERRKEFFLTGGAALAGFYLHHRDTHDLDLFATADVLEQGESSIREVADHIGASLQRLQISPSFRRLLLTKGDEGVVIDLAVDQAPQVSEKRLIGGILVDSPQEIFANKLCALLSRVEPRDLFDVMRLEAAGLDLKDGCLNAARKDGGFSPAQLAWVLKSFPLTDDTPWEGGADLSAYRDDLIRRLAAEGFPEQ